MLGLIFRKAHNKIQDPAKLRRLIADLISERSLIVQRQTKPWQTAFPFRVMTIGPSVSHRSK
jgi:hypothetical protein